MSKKKKMLNNKSSDGLFVSILKIGKRCLSYLSLYRKFKIFEPIIMSMMTDFWSVIHPILSQFLIFLKDLL